MSKHRRFGQLLVALSFFVALTAAAPALAQGRALAQTGTGSWIDVEGLDPGTQFYIPKSDRDALKQVVTLSVSGNRQDADLIRKMISTPQAVWFTGGTPASVERDVRKEIRRARLENRVPVLVAYNLPFRDCSQYSAGGAASVGAYEAWIDGFAAGIGGEKTLVLLEPDGLGIIPWYNPFGDRDTWASNPNYDWCQPAEADPRTAAADRFAMLKYAVQKLKESPNTRVYLDGTHSAWLRVGDISDRLIQAGVLQAEGFFLNVSNYQPTERLVKYGLWISRCVAFATDPEWYGNGHPEYCADQYSLPDPSDFSTWGEVDMWYKNNPTMYGDNRYRHFVIDTSRNGQGPWTPPAGVCPDPQDWCNPPDRGLGLLPTADTGNGLLDAYLWVKIPGESDGQCTRGLGPAGTTVDPEWGRIDPAAGEWFPEMALDLVHHANPPLQ